MNAARPIRFSLAGAVALGMAVLTATPAHAGFFDVDAFDPLRIELEERQANDFNETLNRAQRAQKRAIDRSLVQLDRSADDVSDDIRTAGRIAVYLRRPFRDELTVVRNKVQTLGNVVDDAFDALTLTVVGDADDLSERVPGLEGRFGRRAASLSRRADARVTRLIDTDENNFRKRAGLLRQIARTVALANRFADRADAAGSGGRGLSASVDGMAFKSDFAQSEFYTGDSTLQIYASRTQQDGTFEEIRLLVRGVTGPGTYPLTGGGVEASYGKRVGFVPITKWNLTGEGGSLVVKTLNVAGKRVEATFSFDGFNQSEGTVQIRGGSHVIDNKAGVAEFFEFQGNGEFTPR